MQLLVPAAQHLASYGDALRRGWYPNTTRPASGPEDLRAIAANAAAFLAQQDDPEAVNGILREWLAGGRQTAGAGWRTNAGQARAGATQAVSDERGQDDLGFRLVREVTLDELLDTSPRRPR